MPTARRFARHWFPGLFGTNTPQVSKDSARSAIATWGGRARKHRRYSQFEEEGASELELFDRAGGGAEDAASRTERGADAQDGHAGLINSDAETGGAKMQDENRHNCS